MKLSGYWEGIILIPISKGLQIYGDCFESASLGVKTFASVFCIFIGAGN